MTETRAQIHFRSRASPRLKPWSDEFIEGAAEASKISFARQPMVTVLHQCHDNIAAIETLGEGDARLPRHGFVAHAVQ